MDQRSAFVINGIEEKPLRRDLSQGRGFIQVADDLSAQNPQVVHVFASCPSQNLPAISSDESKSKKGHRVRIPRNHPLHTLFRDLVRRHFYQHAQVRDSAVSEYVSGMLTAFTHVAKPLQDP